MNLLLLVFLLAFALLQAVEVSSTGALLEKTYSLIYFYAPDCQFCAAFDDDFDYLSALYNDNDNLQTVKINGRVHKDIASLFEVNLFPSIKLYDTSESKVVTYGLDRTLENLIGFVDENTDAKADGSNIVTSVKVVASSEELDLLQQEQPVLMAFVASTSSDWNTYYYPNHFFQRIAAENPRITFALVFADIIDSELLQRFRVSNIPSLVYSKGSAVKIYNTLSTNQMINYKLLEESVREFVEKLEDTDEMWFADSDMLEQYANGLEYDGHKHRKPGMNVVNNQNSEAIDIDEEYQRLLNRIEL